MSWQSGTATNYSDLLTRLNDFMLKGHSLPITWTGNGNGTLQDLIGSASSLQETIIVTWTSATDFNVVGSDTGAMGSGTVGTQFLHGRLSFTALAGTTPWSSGDSASFVMTRPWQAVRSIVGSEYIWRAPGDSGTDQIYVGASTFSNASGDYYNWRLGGFTGFQSGNTFAAQPGACTDPVVPLWNSATPYWFIASGKRVIVVAKISTVYEVAYLGFIDAYASPGQWAYPLAVGGSMAWYTEPADGSVSWRWSYTGNEHRGFPFGGYASTVPNAYDKSSPFRVRRPDGTWRGFYYSPTGAVGLLWPYMGGMSDIRPGLDGSYPLFPIIAAEESGATANSFGELSGIMATTGHGNAAENVVTIGRDLFLTVQNVHRTTKTDYACARLG